MTGAVIQNLAVTPLRRESSAAMKSPKTGPQSTAPAPSWTAKPAWSRHRQTPRTTEECGLSAASGVGGRAWSRAPDDPFMVSPARGKN